MNRKITNGDNRQLGLDLVIVKILQTFNNVRCK